MSKYRKLVNSAIQIIDGGFDKMDRSIVNPSLLDRYLVAASIKAIRLSNAITILCEHGSTDEALSILRTLIEHSVNMRWIVEKDTQTRLKMYFGDLGEIGFGKAWATEKLPDRMKNIGFNSHDYFDYCVKLTYSYAHANASSLRWGEVFDHPKLSKDSWSPDALYQVVIQMLGHVIKALNTRYPDKFLGYEELWKQVKVDKNIRKKIEKIRLRFKSV